jgi:hypothetical protein
MQLYCSIQFPKGCSRNLLASENMSGKSRQVSHHNLGGLCWFGHWILDLIVSLIPSYADWLIILPINDVMSEGEIIRGRFGMR